MKPKSISKSQRFIPLFSKSFIILAIFFKVSNSSYFNIWIHYEERDQNYFFVCGYTTVLVIVDKIIFSLNELA